jgi:hypothetical protein
VKPPSDTLLRYCELPFLKFYLNLFHQVPSPKSISLIFWTYNPFNLDNGLTLQNILNIEFLLISVQFCGTWRRGTYFSTFRLLESATVLTNLKKSTIGLKQSETLFLINEHHVKTLKENIFVCVRCSNWAALVDSKRGVKIGLPHSDRRLGPRRSWRSLLNSSQR